jgi:predicted branched-subunit amino acid permease
MTAVIERKSDHGVVDGMRHMAPGALGVVPFAVIIGVAITESPISDPVGFIGGLLVAGGSAHLALTGSIAVGAGVLTTVMTALLINARGLIYGAALAPAMRSQPRWFRWLAAYGLVDQVFALVTSVLDRGDRYVRSYYLGAMGLIWTIYMAAVATGMLLGPVIPAAWPLGVTVPIIFVTMLAPTVKGKPAQTAATVGMAVAVFGSALPAGIGLVLAIIAGTVAGGIVEARNVA